MSTPSKEFWLDRPVFVTGGTGLVGSQLVAQLVELGAGVVCLVRDNEPLSEFYRGGLDKQVCSVRGDIADQALVERALGEYEIKTVLHLAAQTIVGVASRNPISTFESNIKGTWSLLEACRRSPLVSEVLVASSDKAYGAQEVIPYTESTALQGQAPYDVSKSCADLIAQSYAKTFELPVAITRFGNFFGGGDLNWNRIVPGTIRSVVRGERPIIRSDGSPTRDYIYARDGGNAYLVLAEKLAGDRSLIGEAFNFSLELRISALELVEKVLHLMQSDLRPDIQNTAKNEIPHQALDCTKAKERLSWKPQWELEQALEATIDWYKSFLS